MVRGRFGRLAGAGGRFAIAVVPGVAGTGMRPGQNTASDAAGNAGIWPEKRRGSGPSASTAPEGPSGDETAEKENPFGARESPKPHRHDPDAAE